MSHEPYNEELLSAYLDDELSSDDRIRVETWLAESPERTQMLADLRAIREELQSLPKLTLDDKFRRRVLGTIRMRIEDYGSEAMGVTPLSAEAVVRSDKLPAAKMNHNQQHSAHKVSPNFNMPSWEWISAGVAATLLIGLISITSYNHRNIELGMQTDPQQSDIATQPRLPEAQHFGEAAERERERDQPSLPVVASAPAPAAPSEPVIAAAPSEPVIAAAPPAAAAPVMAAKPANQALAKGGSAGNLSADATPQPTVERELAASNRFGGIAPSDKLKHAASQKPSSTLENAVVLATTSTSPGIIELQIAMEDPNQGALWFDSHFPPAKPQSDVLARAEKTSGKQSSSAQNGANATRGTPLAKASEEAKEKAASDKPGEGKGQAAISEKQLAEQIVEMPLEDLNQLLVAMQTSPAAGQLVDARFIATDEVQEQPQFARRKMSAMSDAAAEKPNEAKALSKDAEFQSEKAELRQAIAAKKAQQPTETETIAPGKVPMQKKGIAYDKSLARDEKKLQAPGANNLNDGSDDARKRDSAGGKLSKELPGRQLATKPAPEQATEATPLVRVRFVFVPKPASVPAKQSSTPD